MRSRLAVAMSALALLLSGCGSTAPPNDGTAVPPPPSEGSAPPPSPSPGTRVVLLHGTFTGHYSSPFGQTADQTVQVEVQWNVGPDDVHDPNAFTFTSGSYTFSESIPGLCGGSRTEGGPLTRQSNQFLISGDLQDRDQARVVMVDRRVTDGGLELDLSSGFQVPNGEAGCDGGDTGGVSGCRLLFLQTAADKVQTDATCTVGGTTWTGHLDQ